MSENWMLRNVLFVRKFVEKAHESSFPLGNEIQVAQPVRGGPRGTKWGLHNLYFDWASSSRATDNVGYIAVWHKSMALCGVDARICTSRMTCVAREPTPTHSVWNVPAREGA